MIWFVIWLAFALFIIWLFARSMRTVMGQQKAWAIFAHKHGLYYQRTAWHKAPTVDGQIKGRRVRLYVEEYVDPVRRLREFRTTVEIYFNGGFPTGLAIGSRAYHALLQDIPNVNTVRLPLDAAFMGLMALARDEAIFEAYVSERLEALQSFFSIKRAERLIMGHETEGFIVVQGADTLEEFKDLNARMKLLFKLVDALDPLRRPEPVSETPALPESENETISDVHDIVENEINEEEKEETP